MPPKAHIAAQPAKVESKPAAKVESKPAAKAETKAAAKTKSKGSIGKSKKQKQEQSKLSDLLSQVKGLLFGASEDVSSGIQVEYRERFDLLVTYPMQSFASSIENMAVMLTVVGPQLVNYFGGHKLKEEQEISGVSAPSVKALAQPASLIQLLLQAIPLIAIPASGRFSMIWYSRYIKTVLIDNLRLFKQELEDSVPIITQFPDNFKPLHDLDGAPGNLLKQIVDDLGNKLGTLNLEGEAAIMDFLDEKAALLRSGAFSIQDAEYFYKLENIFVMSDMFLEFVATMRHIAKESTSPEFASFIADKQVGLDAKRNLRKVLIPLFFEFVMTGSVYVMPEASIWMNGRSVFLSLGRGNQIQETFGA
jgi:hypothetical protein